MLRDEIRLFRNHGSTRTEHSYDMLEMATSQCCCIVGNSGIMGDFPFTFERADTLAEFSYMEAYLSVIFPKISYIKSLGITYNSSCLK